jgi:hypothetical protein
MRCREGAEPGISSYLGQDDAAQSIESSLGDEGYGVKPAVPSAVFSCSAAGEGGMFGMDVRGTGWAAHDETVRLSEGDGAAGKRD